MPVNKRQAIIKARQWKFVHGKDDLSDIIRERAEHVVSNLTMKANINRIRCRHLVELAVTDALIHSLNCEEIVGYDVDVRCDDGYKLSERSIPLTATPGDAHGTTGIVLSSDGNGTGVVFDPLAKPPEPGVFNVKVKLKVNKPIDPWVKIEFSVGVNDPR